MEASLYAGAGGNVPSASGPPLWWIRSAFDHVYGYVDGGGYATLYLFPLNKTSAQSRRAAPAGDRRTSPRNRPKLRVAGAYLPRPGTFPMLRQVVRAYLADPALMKVSLL